MDFRPTRIRPARRARHVCALALLLACVASAHAALAQTEAPSATPEATPAAPIELASAPSPTAQVTTAPVRALQRDMSVYGMFMDAGAVAKSVMVLLILASIWNLSILIEKSLVLRRVNRNADRFLDTFRKASSLESLSKQIQGKPDGPMPEMFVAGMNEFHLSVSSGLAATGDLRDRMRARIQDAMEISRTHATHALGRYMSLLATVGSTAPFIGLFGTVWGIMTSFIGIAQTQTTNLAVVAPGIAEALLATAIGLFAAIPAVMLYNKFSRDIGRFSGRLQTFRVGVRDGAVAPARHEGLSDGGEARRHRRKRESVPRELGDERHAVRRRDARAPDHLHDRGAALDRDGSGRAAARDDEARREQGARPGLRLDREGRRHLRDGGAHPARATCPPSCARRRTTTRPSGSSCAPTRTWRIAS